jgi:peptide/nickel transport system substrate-binding protein
VSQSRRLLWPHCVCALFVFCAISVTVLAQTASQPASRSSTAYEELLALPGELGHSGGRLVVSLRAEPKTLNPVLAADAPSRDVIGAMQSDLVHINRATQLTEPALAKSWKISPDGLDYTLTLRQGLRFSDGHPLTADDVVFSFRLYLDENLHSPQRDLLIVGGKPISVRRLDPQTVVFTLAKTYGVEERIFDGLAILPRHLLEKPYQEGKLAQLWNPATPAAQIAGLGPFRLKEYVPGQKLILERNPYYWKTDLQGAHLPYLNELVFLFVPSADAQVLKFQSGETDVISRVSADNFSVLSRQQRDYAMSDAGASLEYNFLFFNLNDLGPNASPDALRKQKIFANLEFRRAVSFAIDRDAIVRLVYQGRGTPLSGPVTPGNRRWEAGLPRSPQNVLQARSTLQHAGFSWRNDTATGESTLLDPDHNPVSFSVLTSSSSAERNKMATLIQDDLKQLGIRVQIVPLEFRSLIDRVTQTKDYDACILGLASIDADPTADMNVWLSSGAQHLWHPSQAKPATPWEAEIDRLMEQQMTTPGYLQRKALFDRVQEILWDNQPMIFLASPHILVGAKNSLANFHPAVLEPYVLWNVDQLYFRGSTQQTASK